MDFINSDIFVPGFFSFLTFIDKMELTLLLIYLAFLIKADLHYFALV